MTTTPQYRTAAALRNGHVLADGFIVASTMFLDADTVKVWGMTRDAEPVAFRADRADRFEVLS